MASKSTISNKKDRKISDENLKNISGGLSVNNLPDYTNPDFVEGKTTNPISTNTVKPKGAKTKKGTKKKP
ncbi:hypothetical protein Lqui_1988 [Legionella quinlivanii]|uniref:Uncharacterized protein n=1 Tax=Legionella quinlivanii TaxID=45073 RepID=A0A0W0XTL9_9GAMM|nr:hypothetical protein [Legionella quinlivanii]KTD48177.1 hypothetical protein Lqui_1988 [Legionella quinlivanii]MCW8450447.1 hypothetical protein [Legionella quinlivanii]SEF99747.1 hypothetical protein SAMN02746093_01627 [Legionella quinlivanii DSM 21216]STY11374.1 Uncharacterised protein [Legionella quinlivanii]